MLESLSTFECQLSRISQFHSSSSSARTAGDMMRNAQGAVYACERLNLLLKQNMNKALEEQIKCEINAPPANNGREKTDDPAEMLRFVGSEFREGLRVSDELVRCVMGLLLGVGRVVRDASITAERERERADRDREHARSISLDEEGLRLNRSRSSLSPEPNAPKHSRGLGSTDSGESGSGSTSKDQRDVRSSSWLPWEHRDWETKREDALRRLSGCDSALGILRSGGTGGGLREARDSPSNPVGRGTINGSGSMRRVAAATTTYTPASSSRVLRDSESTETLHGRYKPSPIPISHTTATTTSRSGTGTGSRAGKKESPNATL
jgi:hypothetical protein